MQEWPACKADFSSVAAENVIEELKKMRTLSRRPYFQLTCGKNQEKRKEFPSKLRSESRVCRPQQTAPVLLHQLRARQFQSYDDSFGQVFKSERIYHFCN